MALQIVLLRGVNLGARNRVSMPELRKLLTDAGFGEVQTYVQSGNVVLSSALTAEKLAAECKSLLAGKLGLEVEVIVRTQSQLAAVVKRNPLGDVATEPKRYQVTFLAEKLEPAVVESLAALATKSERFAAHGRELYAWHPEGVARSKLWGRLAARNLGVTATSRNWTTVTALLEMADG